MTPEYRHTLADCNDAERDLLAVVDHHGPGNGEELLVHFRDVRPGRVWKKHLYRWLDQLVERGYVDKERVSGSENEYSVTEDGREALHRYANWLVDPPR